MLDSYRIVMTHAPAALTERIIIGKVLGFHLIEEASCRVKLAGYLLGVIRIRCHHHQSTNLHMLH